MVNFKKLRKMIEVKGNGHVITKEFQVSSFVRLHISTKGSTKLFLSDEEKVIVHTDEDLMDYFDVTNSGRTLYVSSEAKFRKPHFTECTIEIYLRQIDKLYVRCDEGDVSCGNLIKLNNPIDVTVQSVGNTGLNLDAPSIKVLCQSEGNLTLRGRCDHIEIKNQSQGNLSAREMMAGDLKIKNMAEGNIELCADKTISISHYGEGSVLYWGKAALLDVKQYGDGIIKHME
jgi:hypothetical protein